MQKFCYVVSRAGLPLLLLVRYRSLVGSKQFNCRILLRIVSSLHALTFECCLGGTGGGRPAIVVQQHKRPSLNRATATFYYFRFFSLEGSEQSRGSNEDVHLHRSRNKANRAVVTF